MTPNKEQQDIINFGLYLDENLIVSARAGTGKTSTLLEMVGGLRGVTWFCAFGNRIAGEIEARCETRTDIDKERVRISTVHAAGNRIWKRHLGKFYKPDKLKVYRMVQDRAAHNRLFQFNGWRISKMVELAKQAGFGVLCPIDDTADWMRLIEHFGLDVQADSSRGEHSWEPLIEAAVQVYKVSLESCLEGDMDFSDMLLAPLYYKCRFPTYDNILIDEAQDISPLRLRLILNCTKAGGRIIAVGDPFQAIFGFTGSDDKSMEKIQAITKADTLPMTLSYRCPKTAVALAQTWVPDIRAHDDAIDGVHLHVNLHEDPTGAFQTLLFWDCHTRDKPFCGDDVVLCRNNRPLVQLAHEMIRRKIPCYVEGKDVAAGLVQLAKKWPEVRNLHQLEQNVVEWREEEVEKYKKAKQNYKAEYVEDQANTLLTLMDSCRADGNASVRSLLDLIDRIFQDTPDGKKSNCITLSSIHKAKGKEWERVFLLGREKYMPSQWAVQAWELQQESNLCYVAVTRHLKELIEIRVNGGRRR